MVIWHQMCEVNHACLVTYLYSLSDICTIQMSHGFISWCIHLILIHYIYIYWKQGVYILLLYFVAYIIQRMYVCYIWNIPWNLTFMNCLVKESYKWVCYTSNINKNSLKWKWRFSQQARCRDHSCGMLHSMVL